MSDGDNEKKKLMFSVDTEGDGSYSGLHLHVNDTLIIPFKDLEDWKEFANDMLGMTPEIQENLSWF